MSKLRHTSRIKAIDGYYEGNEDNRMSGWVNDGDGNYSKPTARVVIENRDKQIKKDYPVKMNFGCFIPLCILSLLGLLSLFK